MSNLRRDFERDGYLVLPGFVPEGECDALRARMAEMLEAFEPAEVATIFSTRGLDHAQDRYFLESGDKIRFFFEEEAFDADGRLRQSKARSINKVGHALHDLDPIHVALDRDLLKSQCPRHAVPVGLEAHRLVLVHHTGLEHAGVEAKRR